MMKKLLPLLMALLMFAIPAFAKEEKVPVVLVSVAPYKYFVERIAGDTVSVEVAVPAGASSHTYEPTPKQVVKFYNADVWFQVGEGFEPAMERALKQHNQNLEVVSLRKGVDLIVASQDKVSLGHCCGKDMVDLHIWLSVRQAKAQAKTIASTLIARYPENSMRYCAGLEAFLRDLEDADKQIKSSLDASHVKAILVSHPAFGYYVRDYGIEQLSVEFEGRDPTPQQLTSLLQRARGVGIKTVFVQPQYASKGARLIADQLGARVVEIDPYSDDYLDNLRAITKLFSGQNEQQGDDN